MAKKKHVKKDKRRHDRPVLTEEENTQLEVLLDRLAAQDPKGESFTQFLESLKPLVEQSANFAIAFVEALGTTSSPTAVKVLQTLQEIPAKKPFRRALKTSLYKLERQGLVPKEKETEAEPRILVPRPADRQAEAWASWPESHGERGMLLKLPSAGRGYIVAVAVLDSKGGFRDLDAFQTTRRGVNELFERMTGGVEERLISIPVSHFHYLFREVADIHEKQNRELPAEYDVVQKALFSWVEPVSTPHIYAHLNAKEIADDLILLRSSDNLFELLPFQSWRLHEDLVKPFAEKIKNFSESRLVVSQAAQTERVGQIVREAAVELFTPELRQRYWRLLEETALLLYLEDRAQEAKRALAAAIDLKHEVGRLSENTFILELVKRSIASEADLEQTGDEAQRTGEKRTESGLIIPR